MSTDAVQAARIGRAGLHDALVEVETAISAPVPGRVDLWRSTLHEALIMLDAAFERHLAITEGGGGLFEEIMASSPHLAHAVDEIRAEHRTIGDRIGEVMISTRSMDPVPWAATAVREQALGVLEALIRHRQRGADLVYDAYTIDIGGSE